MGYEISSEKAKTFATYFLLEKMVNGGTKYSLLLEGDDSHLEEILTFMMAKGVVDIEQDRYYVASPKGRQALQAFKNRYIDFLKNYDVFCAVDLNEGEFAFAEWNDIEDDAVWDNYLSEERWEDLRVAVAEFKDIDPLEIVYMGFLNEKRIDDGQTGWQFDLVLGSLWDDIVKVCDTALKADDLGYEDEEGQVSGESVLADVISQGHELMREIFADEGSSNDLLDRANFAGTVPPIPTSAATYNPAPATGGVRRVTVKKVTPQMATSYPNDPRYASPVWKKKRDFDFDFD